MTIDDVADVLGGSLLYRGEGPGRKLTNVVVSDLMSDVLLVDTDDMLLVILLVSD